MRRPDAADTARSAILLLLSCALCSVRGLSVDDGPKTDASRLPGDTSPDSYDLRFVVVPPRPGAAPDAFTAVARITTVVRSATAVVTLNAGALDVTNVTVTDVTGVTAPRRLRVRGWTYGDRDERLEIRLGVRVPRDKRLEVTIWYGGKVRTDNTGLYSTAPTNGKDARTQGWSAVTHFEPTYARRAFPCYDEPSYKATFSISVVRPKGEIALSNMPVRAIEFQKHTDVIYFETTPPMSTYFVSIYVGEFVPNSGNDSRVTVYARSDRVDQTRYIVTEAPKHLDALVEYTGIEYPLPKIDLLAVPDLFFEAMENSGMNTYREYLILLHEESKTKTKIRASEIVQHVISHQWFGDLVTCAWWDYTWLNEGFAQYFQYFATKMVNADWPLEEWFLIEMHQGALVYDQLPRHPITASVATTKEIEDVFDDITYKKGASVLRMLRCLVTENLFRKSIQEYLSDLKESVAEPNDLYAYFDIVLEDNQYKLKDGMTINKFMSNWTLQSGYPVLTVTKNYSLNTFLVTQGRFLIKSDEIDYNTSAWHISLTYTTKSEKNFNLTRQYTWTNESSDLTEISALGSGWYIFNIQSTGFYRVNYDEDNWNALIDQLNEFCSDIHVLNRAQLIDDAFALARAGYLDYSVPLNLSKYLEKENDTTPWYSAINSFSYLIERMPRSNERFEIFKTFVSKLAGTIYRKLDDLVSGGNDEFNVTKAWDAVSTWACALENEDCVKRALEYFNKWKSGKKIPADIKDAAFCVGVRKSTGSSTFNTMFDLYTKTTSYSEKASAESALGCSANRTQLNEYINHLLDGPQGPINERDYKSVITAISATPLGLDVLYEFISTNLNKILDEVSSGEEIAKFIYAILATKITNDDEIEKMINLKNNSTAPESVISSFEKSFSKINDNQLWFDTYADSIIKWTLENQGVKPKPDASSTTVESITSSVSEQPATDITETTSDTDVSSLSSVSDLPATDTTEFTWITDESSSTPISELPSTVITETTRTTTIKAGTTSTTPKSPPGTIPTPSSGSSHVDYSFIISIITMIMLCVNTNVL